jgi:hypothetical protein
MSANRRTKLVGDVQQRSQREQARIYDEQVVTVLIKLWKMMDYICGKRLQPALPELISVLPPVVKPRNSLILDCPLL